MKHIKIHLEPLEISIPDEWNEDQLAQAVEAEIQGAKDNRDITLDFWEVSE